MLLRFISILFPSVERLALVLGGEIVSTFDQPDKVKVGRCDKIEEVIIGEDKVFDVDRQQPCVSQSLMQIAVQLFIRWCVAIM
jgi:chaperonin GroEL (HSP60 family)